MLCVIHGNDRVFMHDTVPVFLPIYYMPTYYGMYCQLIDCVVKRNKDVLNKGS